MRACSRLLFFLKLGIAATLSPLPALACSPAQEAPFNPEAWASIETPSPSKPPTVRSFVNRGRLAAQGESNCSETASVVLAVRDDSPGLSFVYSFEQLDGDAPDAVFPAGLYQGSLNGSGELEFTFYWPDLRVSPKPFLIHVRVTPHSRAGTPGPSTVVVVEGET